MSAVSMAAASSIHACVPAPRSVRRAARNAPTRPQQRSVATAVVAQPVEAEAAAGSFAMSEEERTELATRLQDCFFFCLPAPFNPGKPGTLYVNAAKSEILKGKNYCRLVGGFCQWSVGKFEADMNRSALPSIGGAEWYELTFDIPKEADSFNFVLHGGGDAWDNNEGEDYLMMVEDASLREPVTAEESAALDAEAEKIWAEKHGADLFFTVPSPLVPGKPGAIYFNQHRSTYFDKVNQIQWGLRNMDDYLCYIGFNNWGLCNSELKLERCEGWEQHDDIDWHSAYFRVPPNAFECGLAFSDGGKKIYDNNEDADYVAKVAPNASSRPPRTIKAIESVSDNGSGRLEVVRLDARPGASARAKWKEERVIRVWTPPGYHKDMAGPEGIPVLVLCDGKNLFEDWLAHQGVSWNVGHSASALINEGKLPPFMIVGVDSPGPFRSQCYLPFPPGIGIWDHRPDAERWPGGDVEPYMERVVYELLPLINSHWGGSLQRERLAFGGASFGGVAALYAAKEYPDVFGSILAESPSLWSNMGAFLGMMHEHEGEWSEKIFTAIGTKEYSYNKDHDWDELDNKLLEYQHEAVRILEEKGVHQHEGRLAFSIEEGAGHVEGAWGHRFYGAMQYLFGHLNK